MREHKGKSLLIFPDDFVVIDVETTGTNTSQCKIIEVSALRYSNGAQTAKFSTLVDPETEINLEITSLTGITNEMLYDAPKPEDVFPKLLTFVGDSLLVGHNVSFDVDFLYDAAERHCKSYFTNNYVDTLRIAKRVIPGMAHYRLSDVAAACGVEQGAAHRAEADCITTAECLFAMRRIAEDKSINLVTAQTIRRPKYETVRTKSICSKVETNSSHPLYGKNIVFTGTLSLPREDAMQMAVDVGAILKTSVSSKTDYLVVGVQDVSLVGKTGKSSKERMAEEIIATGKGHIQIINENDFVSLVNTPVSDVICEPANEPEQEISEEFVFELLRPILVETVEFNNANPEKLILKVGKSYSSVWIGTQMAFRICCRNSKRYFSVSTQCFDAAPADIKATALKFKEYADFQNLHFTPTIDGVMFFAQYLSSVMDTAIDSITKEYSCCSRAEECSLSGKCISPFPDIAMLCGYRKVMKSGRIFFGPNRNID